MNWRLGALVVALIVSRAVDQALYYRLALLLEGYGLYFSAIILPIGFLLVLWPIVVYRICTGSVTREMLQFPWSKLAVLGGFDSLYNILSTWPVPAIGGPVSNVLSQSVVPMNLGLSMLVLRTGFTRLHYAGAFLAVYGVLVRMIPALTGHSSEESGNATGVLFVLWVIVMIFSQVPAALSNVYKEVALKGAEKLDVWYTNAVISTFQLGLGILLLPLAGVPGSPDAVDLSKLPQYAADATTCFMGGDGCDDDGVSPVVLFCVFLVFNIAYNILSLAVMQEGSSALFVVASAVRLPLVDLLLLWPWLAGAATAPFTVYDGFAMAALLLAIYLYNADEEKGSSMPPRSLSELGSLVVWALSCRRVDGACGRDGVCGWCCCYCDLCSPVCSCCSASNAAAGSNEARSSSSYVSQTEATRLVGKPLGGTPVAAVSVDAASDDGGGDEQSVSGLSLSVLDRSSDDV